ncbi:MAG: hypothetical protein GY821_01825, partial [Gammaproteobacteria bacterium]|nr:hypothetical protein [Gammaproteobacteria bacterium]
EKPIYYIAVTKSWIKQFIICLAMHCRGSIRGIQQTLKDIVDYNASLEQFSDAQAVLLAIAELDTTKQALIDKCDSTFQSPTWNDKKVTAHHGIIPLANTQGGLGALSKQERDVYDQIARYYIAQFLGNATHQQQKLMVTCEGETFTTTANVPQVLGWKAAVGEEKSSDDTAENKSLPRVKPTDAVTVMATEVASKKTQPPARFTEGTLIAAMKNIAKFVKEPELKKTLRESSGIGTEATRADTIETLLFREFIVRKSKQLISTEKGRSLIDRLPDKIKSPGTTALWEQALADIANGEGSIEAFLFDQVDMLDFMLEDLKTLKANTATAAPTYRCPDCQSVLVYRKSKHGFFWGCSAHPTCHLILKDRKGRPVFAPTAPRNSTERTVRPTKLLLNP